MVKRGASIGANATVICGHTIGEYAFVGAGAVVTRDVPPRAVVYGNPARVRGFACDCGAMLRFDGTSARCGTCHRGWEKTGDSIAESGGK